MDSNFFWNEFYRCRGNTLTMCEFHESTFNGFGDIWWTDNPIYFSSIYRTRLIMRIINMLWLYQNYCIYAQTYILVLYRKHELLYHFLFIAHCSYTWQPLHLHDFVQCMSAFLQPHFPEMHNLVHPHNIMITPAHTLMGILTSGREQVSLCHLTIPLSLVVEEVECYMYVACIHTIDW